MSPLSLDEQVALWFKKSDGDALREVVGALQGHLFAPASVVAVLGSGAIDDLRSELIWRLLRRDGGALEGKPHPVAYSKAAWRNTLAGELRKWGPRSDKAPDVRRYLELTTSAGPGPARALDAERAIDRAQQLPLKGRLAVLLTTRPAAIIDGDWDALVSSLPPPPPRRPTAPLDRDAASLLLFPPRVPEDATARRRRKNNFDQTYSRAIDRLRKLLLPDEP